MGKVLKFLLKAVAFIFLAGLIWGLLEQAGSVVIIIAVVLVVLYLIGKHSSENSSSAELGAAQQQKAMPAPPKAVEKDEMDRLRVHMEE